MLGGSARPPAVPETSLRAKHLDKRVQRSRELFQLLIDESGQQNRPGLKVILDQKRRSEEESCGPASI
jgi:hypothetical protein